MKEYEYNRKLAVEYALRYSLNYNPKYYDFTKIGGDCTNFMSQCIFAGTDTMNFTRETGWYYITLNSRSPAWTSVYYLYKFLVNNKSIGPYGEVTDIDNIEPGDIVQLNTSENDFHHSVIVSDIINGKIFVCAHTYDVMNKPLFDYDIKEIRPIHILGYRKWV